MLTSTWPHDLTLDARHRLQLPAPVREGLPRVGEAWEAVIGVLPKGGDGTTDDCLWLMSNAQYDAFVARLGTLAKDSAQGRQVKTLTLRNFSHVGVDAQGRITIPEKLLQRASIDRTVTLIGMKDRVEIWATEAPIRMEAVRSVDVRADLERLLAGEGG